MEPLRIALCEDSTEEQKKILAILEQSEIPTETAKFANGEDFLKEYRQGKYDLLLMDIYRCIDNYLHYGCLEVKMKLVITEIVYKIEV